MPCRCSRGGGVGGAFGERGPAVFLAFPVAVVGAGQDEVLAVVAVTTEGAVDATDDGFERAQPVFGRDGGQISRSASPTDPTRGPRARRWLPAPTPRPSWPNLLSSLAPVTNGGMRRDQPVGTHAPPRRHPVIDGQRTAPGRRPSPRCPRAPRSSSPAQPFTELLDGIDDQR
jgi:hypothetical protein